MNQAVSEFIKYLQALQPLSTDLIEYLNEVAQVYHIKKNTPLIIEGQHQKTLWFLVDGYAKVSQIIYPENKQYTLWFWQSNQLLIPFTDILGNEPSPFSVSLISKSTLVSVSQIHLKHIAQLYPEYWQIINKSMQNFSIQLWQHLLLLQQQDSLTKYLTILKTKPHLFQYSQLKDVAEYLGMSLSTIKHLRAKPHNASAK